MRRAIPIYYLLPLLSFPAGAQSTLHGRIERRLTTEVLSDITVSNISSAKTNRSDAGGNYRIIARPGDTVVFSSAGYLPDTCLVEAWMLADQGSYDVYLKPNVVRLAPALVTGNSKYLQDSLQRRDDYFWIYLQHQDAVISDTNFTQGFGLSFDLNFYSRNQKEKRELRKRLAREEKDYYIASRFPATYIERITDLHGDSLRIFLDRYRPSYQFCRKSSNEDMFLYINDQVKKFRRPR